MANKITGRVEIIVKGITLLNKAGATANGIGISGALPVELKPVMGDNLIHGFTEELVEASCEVTVTDRDDISISDLARIREQDATLTFAAANGGKLWTLSDATCVRNITITAGEGETTLKYIGIKWTEPPAV